MKTLLCTYLHYTNSLNLKENSFVNKTFSVKHLIVRICSRSTGVLEPKPHVHYRFQSSNMFCQSFYRMQHSACASFNVLPANFKQTLMIFNRSFFFMLCFFCKIVSQFVAAKSSKERDECIIFAL